MKVYTWESKSKNAANAWKQQYFYDNQLWDDQREGTYNELVALKNPSKEDIFRIIGNSSWTECGCNECGNDMGIVVELGDEPDYESRTAWICPKCLQKALELCNKSK